MKSLLRLNENNMKGKSKWNKCCTAGGNKWKKQMKLVDWQSNYTKQMKHVLLKSKWNQTVHFTFEVNSSTHLRIINLFLHVGLHWIRYLVKLLYFFFYQVESKNWMFWTTIKSIQIYFWIWPSSFVFFVGLVVGLEDSYFFFDQ